MVPGHVICVLKTYYLPPSLHLSKLCLPFSKQFCPVGPRWERSLCSLLPAGETQRLTSTPGTNVLTSCLHFLLSPRLLGPGLPSSLFLLQECPSFWQTCLDSVRSSQAALSCPRAGHSRLSHVARRNITHSRQKGHFVFAVSGMEPQVWCRLGKNSTMEPCPAFHWGILGKLSAEQRASVPRWSHNLLHPTSYMGQGVTTNGATE